MSWEPLWDEWVKPLAPMQTLLPREDKHAQALLALPHAREQCRIASPCAEALARWGLTAHQWYKLAKPGPDRLIMLVKGWEWAIEAMRLEPDHICRILRGSEGLVRWSWLESYGTPVLTQLGFNPTQSTQLITGRDWQERAEWIRRAQHDLIKQLDINGYQLSLILRAGVWEDKVTWLESDNCRALMDYGFLGSHLAQILRNTNWKEKLTWTSQHYESVFASRGFDPTHVAQLLGHGDWRKKLDWLEKNHQGLPEAFDGNHIALIMTSHEWDQKLDWLRLCYGYLFEPMGFNGFHTAQLLSSPDWREKIAWIERYYRSWLEPFGFTGYHACRILSHKDWRDILEWISDYYGSLLRALRFDAAHLAQLIAGGQWREKLQWIQDNYQSVLYMIGFDGPQVGRLFAGKDWQAKLEWLRQSLHNVLMPLGLDAGQLASILEGKDWKNKTDWLTSYHLHYHSAWQLNGPAIGLLLNGKQWKSRVDFLESDGWSKLEAIGIRGNLLGRFMASKHWPKQLTWLSQEGAPIVKDFNLDGLTIVHLMQQSQWLKQCQSLLTLNKDAWREAQFRGDHIMRLLDASKGVTLLKALDVWLNERQDTSLLQAGHITQIVTQSQSMQRLNDLVPYKPTLERLGVHGAALCRLCLSEDYRDRLNYLEAHTSQLYASGVCDDALAKIIIDDAWQSKLHWCLNTLNQHAHIPPSILSLMLNTREWERKIEAWDKNAWQVLIKAGWQHQQLCQLLRYSAWEEKLTWLEQHFTTFHRQGLVPALALRLLNRGSWKKTIEHWQAHEAWLTTAELPDPAASPLLLLWAKRHVLTGATPSEVDQVLTRCTSDSLERFKSNINSLVGTVSITDIAQALALLNDKFQWAKADVELMLKAINKSLRGLPSWINTGQMYRSLVKEDHGLNAAPAGTSTTSHAGDALEAEDTFNALLNQLQTALPHTAGFWQRLLIECQGDIESLDSDDQTNVNDHLQELREHPRLMQIVYDMLAG